MCLTKVRESISLHILACMKLKRLLKGDRYVLKNQFMVRHQKFPKSTKTTVIPDYPLEVARPQKLDLRQKYIIFVSRIAILLLKESFKREKIIFYKKN